MMEWRRKQHWIGWLGIIASGVVYSAVLATSPLVAQAAYRVATALPLTPVMDSSPHAKQPTPAHRVTLIVHDSTIIYAVHEVIRQAHLRSVFNTSSSTFVRRISVRIVNADPLDALTEILRGTGLVAKMGPDGETVMIRAQTVSDAGNLGQGAVGVVIGTVSDSANEKGVSGATVKVDGTMLSAVTDESGKFVLRGVPVGKQFLTVKVFGYKAASSVVTVMDSTRALVRVALVPVATVLSGVVTTATGVQSKMSVGSDITTINVDSVMKTAPISSVTDLLENRVPGLTVEHTSGTPGDPSRLLLRGAASAYGSNNPIVVVDGVRVYDPQDLGSVQEQLGGDASTKEARLARPSPLDQIDPNTIATIEVLKGPSASALYGSDAANGVIVITTKKGVPGKTHWSVNATQGVSYVPGDYPTFTYVFGHPIFNQNLESQCLPASGSCVVDSVRTFQALNNPRFSPLTSGPLSSLSSTVSGGASALTYSFTGGTQNTHGMTKLPSFAAEQYTEAVGSAPPMWMRHPDDYVRWNGSGRIQATLSPQMNLAVSDMLGSSTQHRTDLGLSAVGDLIGVYVDTTNIANTPTFTDFFTQITQATLTSTTNATLQWRVRPWLPLQVTAGYNRNQETDKRYLPAGLPSTILPAGGDTSGLYDLGTLNATVATLNANTTIPFALGRGPGLQLALGTNFVSQSTAGQDIMTSQIPVGVSDPTTFPQTTATNVVQRTQSAATYGWFAEPQLMLHSRLFITPGIRLDGGTASGSEAALSVFPKTNFSYIAVDHTDQTGRSGWANTLSLLRLRGSFGIAGVQPTPGQALRLFSTPNIVTLDGGTVSTTGTALTTLGNTLLHPERSREMEAGFDAQLFQDRITVTATYYNKLRVDAIEALPVAPSILGVPGSIVGYTEYQNVGNIRNRGVEVSGTMRVLDRRTVTWSVNGSVSTNDNRVLSSLSTDESGCKGIQSNLNFGYQTCILTGYPLNARFGAVVAGYSDLNGDGLIDNRNEIFLSDSSVYIGSTDPRYTASFGTTLTLWHGQLSLAASGSYQNGITVQCFICRYEFTSEAHQPGADIQTQIANVLDIGGIGSYGAYQVVNVLRLNAMSLNLTLPARVARAVRAQQATLSVQGSNLGVWTNYAGKDPLATGAVSGLDNQDSGGLPLPETWQVGVRITE